MSGIIKHIFSKKDKIPVFKDFERTDIVGYLPKGEWMGLLSELPEKVKIVSKMYHGWVNKEDIVEQRTHLKELHPQVLDGEIRYFLSF
jgi:hypothetical protein